MEARAAKTPSVVARIAVETAMMSEFFSACPSAALAKSSSNHFVVKPFSGNAMMVPSLKAKIGRSAIGA